MTQAQKNKVFYALLLTGFPITEIPLAMKQISFEVGDTHPEAGNNNWSGIGKALWEQGVKDDDHRFSNFNTINDWARAYKHILKNLKPSILAANNIKDWANAVYNTHYTVQEGSTDDVDSYAAGMQRYDRDIKTFIAGKIAEGIALKIIIVLIIIFIYKKLHK